MFKKNKGGVSENSTNEQLKPVAKKKKTGLKAVIFIGGALALAIVVGILVPNFMGNGAEAAVTIGQCEVTDLETDVTVKGSVVGSDSADVNSALNYRITEILVEVGDNVTKGQVLAKLDASDLTEQYNIQRIAYNDAKKAYDNAKVLYNEGAISKSEYDAAESSYKTASLNLSAYDINEKSTITSPIDGTVTRVNCTVGRIAGDTNNHEAMFVIEDISNLKMEIKVSEYDISEIRVGQEAVISADILGKDTVKGVVSKIAPTGELKADGTGMVIPVTIDIDKGDTNLIAGVTAKATIITDSREDVLTVPFDSILEDPDTGDLFVFTVDENNVVTKVPVETGLEGEFMVEITNGDLTDGQNVILSPDLSITDGMTVMVM